MRTAGLLLAAALTGCGGGSPTIDPDGAPIADAAADAANPDAVNPDAAPCLTIDSCGWLEDYQREIVGKLAGQREIAPGVTLNRRASSAQRTTARTYLVDELTALGFTPELHAYSGSGANVIVTLPPTTGVVGDLIVLGAHFDGVPAGPAAADNATGVAVVLSAARYLATVTPRAHPIELVLFDQEEIGLVGSRAYVQTLLTEAVPVAAVHNFDMISFDGDGDQAVELWSPSPSLETQYRNVASPIGIPIQPVTFASSDHQAFVEEGFTVVGVCEEFVADDHTPHYHLATDTYDKINFAYLGMVTRLALNVLTIDLADPD
jgi:hypothetical protein